MKRLLVIEDGHEYEEFARLFLAHAFEIHCAHSVGEALEVLSDTWIDGFLLDLRFDRAEIGSITGDIEATTERLFAGDRSRAASYLKDNQGVLILAELRPAGHDQPAVFVHDFAPLKMENLTNLYGNVKAVPSFDAASICRALAQ